MAPKVPTDVPGARVTILDGGTGRELLRQGAPFRQPEWSALALMEAPDSVRRVHESFAAAGAGVLTTNSYAVVPFHLGAARFASDGARLAALAGRLARAAADTAPATCRVAGSLPPACGSYRPDLFDEKAARPVLETLAAALAPCVDLWLAETLSSTAEARLVRAVVGADPRPLWLSFTLADEDVDPAVPRLRSGEPVEAAVAAARAAGAAAVLFNCSQPEVMAAAVERARTAGAPAVGVYANAFEPQGPDAAANEELTELRRDLTPEGYLRFADEWVQRGATIIGGCCGIGPEHIHALAAHLAPAAARSAAR